MNNYEYTRSKVFSVNCNAAKCLVKIIPLCPFELKIKPYRNKANMALKYDEEKTQEATGQHCSPKEEF